MSLDTPPAHSGHMLRRRLLAYCRRVNFIKPTNQSNSTLLRFLSRKFLPSRCTPQRNNEVHLGRKKIIAHCSNVFPTERPHRPQTRASPCRTCCKSFNLQSNFSCAIGHRLATNSHGSRPGRQLPHFGNTHDVLETTPFRACGNHGNRSRIRRRPDRHDQRRTSPLPGRLSKRHHPRRCRIPHRLRRSAPHPAQ